MNRLEKIMDDTSKLIDRSYQRRINNGREVREGIKFLGECLLLPVKEVKEYFSNNEENKEPNGKE